jgi:hypothetical protein
MAIQDFTAGQVLTAAQMDSLQANDYNWTVSTKTASYVLAAADKGTRVVMNAAGATTITVNTSIFAAGDTLFIQNINSGTCTITAGTCTVNTAGSLALAQWQGGVLYFTSASTAIFFLAGSGTGYGTATGGSSSSITVGGINYTLLTFTTDSTLTVTKAGLFDYYIVAGGGAGGVGQSNVSGAGGGAGGVLTGTAYFSANQTIDIGAGGTGSTTAGAATNGLASVIGSTTGSLSAVGGGRGGGHNAGSTFAGNGGSGGGSSYSGADVQQPGVSVANTIQGYGGGTGTSTLSVGAAGGGGATAIGGSQTGSSTTGAVGGAGVDVSTFISGAALYKAGGGGGGGATGGAGGSSVGGAGGNSSSAGNAAAANTGGGGGGCGYGASNAGGAGGSGIIYIRFKV